MRSSIVTWLGPSMAQLVSRHENIWLAMPLGPATHW
jgi:hypothetical protein